MDDKDLLLLDALQEDASRKLDELAKLLRLVPSSVHDRIRRLTQRGVIRRWTIKVDHAALDLNTLAFIGIKASRPCAEMLAPLKSLPAIEECHSVAGSLSLLLKVRVPHTADLMQLTEELRRIPGVESTETTIVLKSQLDRHSRVTKGAATTKKRTI